MLRTNASPGDDIVNGSGRWIQITAVNPEFDLRKWAGEQSAGLWLNWESHTDDSDTPTSRRPSVDSQGQSDYPIEPELDPSFEPIFARAEASLEQIPESVKEYYRNNEISMFSFSRPFKRPLDFPIAKDDPAREFLELWTEKTLLVTEDIFPCLSRRSLVAHTRTVALSPIENAVMAVRAKNRQLREFERKYEPMAMAAVASASVSTPVGSPAHPRRPSTSSSGTAQNVNLFTMALNGAVDAPVNGGVPMYRRAFLSGNYRPAGGSDLETYMRHAAMLQQAIEEQVEIVYRSLAIHDAIVPPQMRPLHETLVGFFYKNFESEIARLGLSKPSRGSRLKYSSKDWHGDSQSNAGVSRASESFPPTAGPRGSSSFGGNGHGGLLVATAAG
ncbi:hypothetical protein HK405_014669, partial [Cladochytrium tenue]